MPAARAQSFYSAIREYRPDLPDGALQPAYAGIRPMAEGNYVRAYQFIMPWTQLRPQQINPPRPRVSRRGRAPI